MSWGDGSEDCESDGRSPSSSPSPPRRAGARTENESDSAFSPSTLHPIWETWSRPVALAVRAGFSTFDKIHATGLDMPGFRLRNCLAWLELAGIVFYVRSLAEWRLAPYGVRWLAATAEKTNGAAERTKKREE
jgi:hypothetical protein